MIQTPEMTDGRPTADIPERGWNSLGFWALALTQLCGALNDNLFRWLAVPLAKKALGDSVALALGLACFTLPYLLLASYAAYFADRFSKRRVIVACKVAEIGLMLLGLLSIYLGSVGLMFAVVTLLGVHSALYAPAKFGSIPEMVQPSDLARANGIMGMLTVVASAAGVVAGFSLFDLTSGDIAVPTSLRNLLIVGGAPVALAIVGTLISLFIVKVPAANPRREFPVNPALETAHDLRTLWRSPRLLRTAWGIGFFWLLASLANMNIDVYGLQTLRLEQSQVGPLLGILVLGLGAGSVLAGLMSSGRVELGIVPLGALGVAVSSLLLYLAGTSAEALFAETGTVGGAYVWTCVFLFTLGVSAGLFDIPLETNLQKLSTRENRGTILAASNFIAFALILSSSGLFWLLRKVFELDASQIFLVCGIGTVPVMIYVAYLLPDATVRCVIWLLSKVFYRIRVRKLENLPETGGALLVANHVSWLDGVILLLISPRPIRMLAYADYFERGVMPWVAKTFGIIPIKDTGGPKALLRSLQTAKDAVQNGELVCIFAEGALTRTGQIGPFQKGLLRIVQGTDAPVLPVYLDELWGSIFSFHGGKYFWKWPRQMPYPVTITFGEPMRPEHADEVRQAVLNLGAESMESRKDRQLIPARLFLRQCKRGLFRSKLADSSGVDLKGGEMLTRTLIVKKLLENHIAPDEKTVGVFLPPSVPGALVNLALSLMGKVAVNLNYTMSADIVNYCIKAAGIKHVITSRKFQEKMPHKLDGEIVLMEDEAAKVTGAMKAAAAFQAFAVPAWVLERKFGLHKIDPDETLTIIFTSGSTGEPKGVMLSHFNILSNISGVDQLFQLNKDDVFMGVLPFFHSFGYTGTIWLMAALPPKTVYHFNPLDGRTVGELSGKHGATILLATPTFLRTYLKRCTTEQFGKLSLVIVGAEKMPMDLYEAFKEKFGLAPTEGYGTTELSPVAAFNVPANRAGNSHQVSTKLGTVGRVMPGTTARVVDVDSGKTLGLNAEGLLQIKGPNVMKGYLNQPEKTAELITDGWYNTGDMGMIDSDGFISITGRQSRFSKIGGEMVPHIRVEELLTEIVENPNDEETDLKLAVTSVPDEKKGERLIVLHKPLGKPVDEILRELSQKNLPNIWLPGRDSFIEVASIPLLGTGKLDLKGIKQLALEKCAPEHEEAV